MKLKKLTLRNIRSYEEQEIYFPEGAVLLAGDVGSGKTSLLLAVEYALFGLQPGQTGALLLRNSAQSADVILDFEIDGQEFTIERKLKRGAKSIANEYAAIRIQGVKRECSITELKTQVLELLGYPQEFLKKNNLLYKYTVYTPQEQMKQIILEEPETRLNILRHILGVGKYKIIRENLSLVLNRIKDESKIIQGEISSLASEKSRADILKNLLLSLEKNIREKENEVMEAVSRRKYLESEVEALQRKIKEREKLESELEKTKVLISSKKDGLAEIKKEISEIEKSLESSELFNESLLKETVGKLGEAKSKEEALGREYSELKGQSSALEQNKQEIASRKERVFKMEFCPTCLQDVPYAHKHNIVNETDRMLSEINAKIEMIEQKKKEIMKHGEEGRISISGLEERKAKLEILRSRAEYVAKSKERLVSFLKNRDNAEKDVLLLSKHIETLKSDILKLSAFVNQHRTKQEELKKAFAGEKQIEIEFAEIKKERELIEKEAVMIEGAIKEKEEKKRRLSHLTELSDWLSNQFLNLVNFTERNVMIKLRMEFSRVFSKWFRMLAGELFDVKLDENFTPLIMQGESEMDYSFLSGGERTAVALAYRLALNQTINSVFSAIKTKDIVILDEPTDGFSEAQLDKMRDVLRELKVKQLLIVSHEQKIEGFVDNIIRLKKEGDASRIESSSHSLNIVKVISG